MSGKRLSRELRAFLGQLREESTLDRSDQDSFEIILKLVEHIATQEDVLVACQERAAAPDAVAERFLHEGDAQALSAVQAVLSELSPGDLRRVEAVLGRLQKRHGTTSDLPLNQQLLLDAALLGQVGFVFSRRHGEVLTTRTVASQRRSAGLFAELVEGVDSLFPDRQPRYFWRLGPEFGSDRNIRLLLDRQDAFVTRSATDKGAADLAESVLQWKRLPGTDGWIGESCEPSCEGPTLRRLVVKKSYGSAMHHGLLLTNVENVPWDELYRLHRARRLIQPEQSGLRIGAVQGLRPLAASLLVLAFFAFRNMATWAAVASINPSPDRPMSVSMHVPATMSLLVSSQKPEFIEHMTQYTEYLRSVTGDQSTRLRSIRAAESKDGYDLRLRAGTSLPSMANGEVLEVAPADSGQGLSSVVVRHSEGFTTRYDNIRTSLRAGSKINRGDVVGTSSSRVRPSLSAQVARVYLEQGREPSIAQSLRNEDNIVLDPLSRLVQQDLTREDVLGSTPDGRMRTELPLSLSRTLRESRRGQVLDAWRVDEADVFMIRDGGLPQETAFLASHLLKSQLPEGSVADSSADIAGLLPGISIDVS